MMTRTEHSTGRTTGGADLFAKRTVCYAYAGSQSRVKTMKRMTFIAGGFARFPKAHGKPNDQCELTPEEIQQIRTMSASSEPVFTSAKRWPAIDKLVAKINRTSS